MDIRDAINNPVGRDVYPKISNVEVKSGSGATPVTQNLVVEVKTVTPQWSNPNGTGESVRPHDTPDRYDYPAIDLAPYLVSDKDGTYDNAILKLTYTLHQFSFSFIPDGASTAENITSPVFEFELDPSKLEGVSTVYSGDGLFRADLHYYLNDEDIILGNYENGQTSTGRALVIENVTITYDAKVLDSSKKVTGHIGFQANASLMPPNLGTNHTEYPYKLAYLNFTGCSRNSGVSVPTVIVAGGDAHPKQLNKFYITTLKLESEN